MSSNTFSKFHDKAYEHMDNFENPLIKKAVQKKS